MALGDTVKKIGLLGRMFGVLDGKKTLSLQIIAIISLAWSFLAPGTAPSQGDLTGVYNQGVQVVHTVQHDLLPQLVALGTMVLALFTGIHSQSKIALVISTICRLLGRYVSIPEIKELHGKLVTGTVVETVAPRPIAEVSPVSAPAGLPDPIKPIQIKG